VQQADGSWREVEANTVTVGSVVRVKPGERIGLDGDIVRAAPR
jgi:Cd2+/Zn2+-exporting ATPase